MSCGEKERGEKRISEKAKEVHPDGKNRRLGGDRVTAPNSDRDLDGDVGRRKKKKLSRICYSASFSSFSSSSFAFPSLRLSWCND